MAQDHRRKRRRAVLLVGLLGSLCVASGQLSLALFTDAESVDGSFGTGSIQLDAGKIDQLALSTGTMMPGDSITDDVVVENDGTAQLRYSMATSSTDSDGLALRNVLTVTVKTVDATTPGTPCDDFDGTSVLASTVLGASAAGFGNPTPGGDTGDRTLAAAASETLCFRVSLPSATGNAYQGAATTTTFTFDAEQTSSNP